MVTCLSPSDPNNNFNYCPSNGASILFSILFGSVTLAHIVQAFLYKKAFCWVLIMGGIWETTAFIIRNLAIRNPTSRGLFDPQFVLILVAPLWINAFDYMVFGRMVHFFLPGQRIMGLQPKRMALVFVLLDISAFIVQLVGALSTTGTNTSTVKIGLDVYTGGVALQQAFILFFITLVIQFHRKIKTTFVQRPTDWKRLLYTLYASLALITVRIIYRIIEYSTGPSSVIPDREAYAYCFDSLLMLIALFLFNLVHPGSILVGPESEFPKVTRAEKKRVKAEKKAAKKMAKEDKKRDRKIKSEEEGVILK